MYSKIPVPHPQWNEKQMRYTICFFPVVGAAIGLLIWLWFRLCAVLAAGDWMRILVAAVIPLLVTGGIHVDGFMDTSDALHSYQERARKLEILKDSHIGAFAVIMLAGFLALWVAGVSQLSGRAVLLWCTGFVYARILSGLSVVSFPNAKKEGTLYTFSSMAHKRNVRIILLAELLVCVCLMLWSDPFYGILTVAAGAAVFGYYFYRSGKEFGGITGDVAGWFLCLCELCITLTLAFGTLWMERGV